MEDKEKINILEEFIRRVEKSKTPIYPKAVRTGDPDVDYERTDFMKGWNEGIHHKVSQIAKIMDELYIDIDDETGEIIYDAPKD